MHARGGVGGGVMSTPQAHPARRPLLTTPTHRCPCRDTACRPPTSRCSHVHVRFSWSQSLTRWRQRARRQRGPASGTSHRPTTFNVATCDGPPTARPAGTVVPQEPCDSCMHSTDQRTQRRRGAVTRPLTVAGKHEKHKNTEIGPTTHTRRCAYESGQRPKSLIST